MCAKTGTTEGVFFIEYVLEHLARVMHKPSLDLRKVNFLKNGDHMLDGSVAKDLMVAPITEQLLASSDYTTRAKAVADFNEANRWRKKGISVIPIRFPCYWMGGNYNCLIAVFHNGGTVGITHGGVEMGQGLNTKVKILQKTEIIICCTVAIRWTD